MDKKKGMDARSAWAVGGGLLLGLGIGFFFPAGICSGIRWKYAGRIGRRSSDCIFNFKG